jgi:hypothetical protein
MKECFLRLMPTLAPVFFLQIACGCIHESSARMSACSLVRAPGEHGYESIKFFQYTRIPRKCNTAILLSTDYFSSTRTRDSQLTFAPRSLMLRLVDRPIVTIKTKCGLAVRYELPTSVGSQLYSDGKTLLLISLFMETHRLQWSEIARLDGDVVDVAV